MARRSGGLAPRGVCSTLCARGDLLFPRFSALGLAADVLYWRIAGITGHLRTSPGEGIRGLAENAARNLEPTRSRDCFPLETVYLSCALDDDDELRLARNPGYVPDAAQTCVAFQSSEGGGRDRVHNGWSDYRRALIRALVRSLWPSPLDDSGALLRDGRYSSLGPFTFVVALARRRVSHAVYGSGSVGDHSGTPDRTLSRFGSRFLTRLCVSVRRCAGRLGRFCTNGLRRENKLSHDDGVDYADRALGCGGNYCPRTLKALNPLLR